MFQPIYIIVFSVFLNSLCLAEPTQKLTPEQLKVVEEKKKEMLKTVQKVLIHSQPESIYADYLKSEIMVPNLEPVKDRVYGDKSAKDKLVVFAAFACGHCKTASKDLKARVNENKKLVNLTYVLYPLDQACNKFVKGKFSDYSCVASKLALCSEKKGKIWKAIDYLYEHQTEGKQFPFDPKTFTKNMSGKLKISDLDACINSKWVEERLNNEQLVYKDLKIPGTPIILLNNRRLGNTYKSQTVFGNFIKYLDLKEHPKGK